MASYCTIAELATFGINAEAMRGMSDPAKQAAIDSASDEIDGYLASRYVLPLTAWESDLRRHCACMAVYTLLVTRGFNPDRPGDQVLVDRNDAALDWLKRISNGTVVPRVTDSSSAPAVGKVSGGVKVSSWGSRGYVDDTGNGGAFQGRR
jgi:phage gp36-like protein